MFSCFKCCFQQQPNLTVSIPANPVIAASTDIPTARKNLEKMHLTDEEAHAFIATKYRENNVIDLEACLHLFPKIPLYYTHTADPTEQIFNAAAKGCWLFIARSLEYKPELLNVRISNGTLLETDENFLKVKLLLNGSWTMLTVAVCAEQTEVVSQILKHASNYLALYGTKIQTSNDIALRYLQTPLFFSWRKQKWKQRAEGWARY